MRRAVASLVGGLALLLAATSLAVAAEGDAVRVSVSPIRVEFLGAEGLASVQAVDISITGGGEGTVSIAMLDAVLGDDDRWRDVGYGSTDSSLRGVLRIEPKTFDYVPDGATQTFTARLTVNPDAVTRPLYGSLLAVLGPAGATNATVVQQAGVAIRVVAAPDGGGDAGEGLSIGIGDLAVSGGRGYTPLEAFLPDIPGVVGRGPLDVSVPITNTSGTIVDARVTYSFTRVSLLALLPGDLFEGRPLVVVNRAPRYLLPGQRAADLATTEAELDDGTLDATPFLGLLRISATATATIAGRTATSETRTQTVLAFPWAESLILLAGVVVTRRSKRRHVGRSSHARRRLRVSSRTPRRPIADDETVDVSPREIAPEPTRRRVAAASPSRRSAGFAEWWVARGRETEARMSGAGQEGTDPSERPRRRVDR